MKTSKRYAHSQILWMTRNPLLCLTHFILFVSIIELLLFISTNGAVCWPAPRIFGKAPSILQITYISSQRGWGVRPMVASVVLKIRCAPKSVKSSGDLDFIRFYLCHAVRCRQSSIYAKLFPEKANEVLEDGRQMIGFASRLICQRHTICWHLRCHLSGAQKPLSTLKTLLCLASFITHIIMKNTILFWEGILGKT